MFAFQLTLPLVILLCPLAAEALSCYSCILCKENEKYKTLSDCKACLKTVIETEFATQVTRACSPAPASEYECKSHSVGSGKVTACFCNSHLCNKSAVTGFSPTLLSMGAISAFLLSHLSARG